MSLAVAGSVGLVASRILSEFAHGHGDRWAKDGAKTAVVD
jgi:hypothetical protein